MQNHLLISTILFSKSYNLIWSSFYSFARHIFSIIVRVNIYLFIYSTISSAITRVFCQLQFEKNFELYAFVSQINAFSSISFETIHWFVRQQFTFFRICTSIFITVWNIWSKHTRLQVNSTRFFCSRSRMHVMNLYRKFSSKTTFTSLVKFSNTYKERLANLQIDNWNWNRSKDFSKKNMIAIEFNDDDWCEIIAKCTHCSLKLFCNDCKESLKKHIQKSSHCSLVLQFHEENATQEKIAEKKMTAEFSVSLVEFLSTYENRLTSLQNWDESTTSVNNRARKLVVVVDFQNYDNVTAKCIHCYLSIFQWDCKKSFKKHFQKSFDCSLILQLETTRLEISKTIVEIVKRAELKILKVKKLIEFETLKVSKFIFVAVDIEYFDSTLLCDIQEFDLHHESANFCQHLQNIRVNYREKKLLALLFECFRNSALIWYRQQQNEIEIVKSLNEWLEILIIAFFAKSFANLFFSKFDIFASFVSLSSQYHFCLNCFAFFSSLTRLLQHTQIVCQKVVCKQCDEIFESKNKFHEHIRQHHAAKKIDKFASRRSFNRERNRNSTTISTISSTISKSISFKTTTKFSISRSVTFPEQTRNSFISFAIFAATSKQIFWTRIVSTSVISSKRSRFSIFTLEITSKSVKIASTTCSLSISLATSASRFRKSISKFHFTIDDLIRMFREKFSSFDLSQHQKRRSSSQRFDARLYQSRIIVYFLSAVNQETSISQNLKSSNSKNFQQHTFAKSLSSRRFVSVLSEKSIFSLYKKANIFYILLQSRFSSRFSFLQSKFSFAWFRFTFSFTFSSFFRFSFSNHVCCICFDHFSFRNDLFDYSRFSQRYFWNRRSMRKIWKR